MPHQSEFRHLVVHDEEKCYCNDTLKHLKFNEQKYYILKKDFYADNFKDCSFYRIRQRLIEWLIIVQDYYSSSEETLEMSIRLFDYIYFKDLYSDYQQIKDEENNNVLVTSKETKRKATSSQGEEEVEIEADEGEYCNCGSYHNGWLRLEELQLVALACFFLSCKFWERFPPKLSKLINLTEHNFNYSEQQLLEKEREILQIINFDLKIPLITQYLEFYMLHETNFLLNKIIPVCHYLYNLTLTETRFLNRPASALGAVILTLAKMILCSFSSFDPAESQFIYDAKLFTMQGFNEILNDLWAVFQLSVLNRDSFRLQKKKFSDQKYSYLPLYIESVKLDKIFNHFIELKKNVNSVLLGNL